jgi:replicative DNA helicase
MTAPSTVDRPLPHNIELEQALLGAILLTNDAFHHVAAFLEPRHFYEPLHAKMYEIAASLIRAGKVATVINLRTFLPPALKVDELTVSQYLARLAAEATTIINAADYGRFIRDFAERRDLIAICETTIAAAMNTSPDQDAQAIGNAAIDGLAEIVAADRAQGGTMKPIGVAMADFVEHVAAVYQGTASNDVIKTGLCDLDERTGGMARGSLVVLAGRPGMGKTTVAAAIGRNVARNGHGVAFFSLEMPSRQIMARMLSDSMFDAGHSLTADNRLSVHRISKAKFSPMEFDSIVDTARAMERWPFSIDDTPHATAGSILAKCQATKKRLERAGQRLDVVLIDYLKFLRASERYAGQRHYEVGELTAGLKQLARKLDCVVVLCAQLNRQVEQRQDRRPQLSDLRESGDIEADADIVLLLFREAYYLGQDPDITTDANKMRRLEQVQHVVEFIVAKNRTGPTDTIPTFINLEFSAVRDLARQSDLDFARPR